MNLIVEKTRKNDVFEILITPPREAFRIHETSQRFVRGGGGGRVGEVRGWAAATDIIRCCASLKNIGQLYQNIGQLR